MLSASQSGTLPGDFMSSTDVLIARQDAFIAIYSGNVRRDCEASGMPYQTVCRWFRDPAFLERLRERCYSPMVAERNELLEFWSRVMRGEVMPGCTNPAKVSDRLKAAEALAKAQLLLTERVVHEGGDKPIQLSASHSMDVTERAERLMKRMVEAREAKDENA